MPTNGRRSRYRPDTASPRRPPLMDVVPNGASNAIPPDGLRLIAMIEYDVLSNQTDRSRRRYATIDKGLLDNPTATYTKTFAPRPRQERHDVFLLGYGRATMHGSGPFSGSPIKAH